MFLIDRFRNGNILDKDTYNYNDTLYIPDASGMEGAYRCRAVNDFGAEFSNIADLTVFGRLHEHYNVFLFIYLYSFYHSMINNK